MSKSATASAPKISSQLPQKSAWARGPPTNTSTAPSTRSQSPAPSVTSPATATHSRRPSTLGQGVSFKDGVAGTRGSSQHIKSGSSVTFGSIDDVAAPMSSSPAAVPPIKSESIKQFGSVQASPSSVPNGRVPSTSTSTSSPSTSSLSAPSASASASAASSSAPAHKPHPKVDVKKFFQSPSSGSSTATSSSTPSDITSPSNRPTSLPPSATLTQGQQGMHHQPQPSQLGAHSYTPFVPGALRPQQNGAGASPGGVPRSPSYPRQIPNGTVNGRPTGAPGGPGGVPVPTPMSAGMPSPRMGPPQLPQPVPVPGWPGYYYPYPGMAMDQQYIQYPQQWMPQPVPPQHHPQQGPPGPPMGGMPMSPRAQPPQLHPPGTPTLTPAIPSTGHPPHTTPSPHTHTTSLSSVSSPPSTPLSTTAPGGGLGRLNSSASTFVPRKVTIKDGSGLEVDLERFKKAGPVVSPPVIVPSSPARKTVVRMETPEAKAKRLAEENEKERLKKAAEETARRAAEEEEKKKREEERRKKEEEEERVRKEEEKKKERLRKEEEEREKLRKEEEDKERLRKEEEEKERLRLEEERAHKAEEERLAKEAAQKAEELKALAAEEGEVEEAPEAEEAADDAAKEEAKDKVSDKGPLRIDTAVHSETPKRRPGPLDLSGTKVPIPAPLPSALATARVIEDLGSIAYPEGIKSPKVELNVNAKQGKFRYDREFLLQFMAICKEKPDSLPPLDAIGLEPADQNFAMSRGGSGRRTSSASMPPPASTAARQASIGLGISGFPKPPNPFNMMGQFSTPSSKMSSEERFQMSSRSTSMSGGPAGMPFGRPSPMVRSSSQGGPGGHPMGSGRTRSQRGGRRDKENKVGGGPSGQSSFASGSSLPGGLSMEPVAPLEASANRWQAGSLGRKAQAPDADSPEVVDRKVRGLLNKLTMERFDSISDQIITWANRSEKEKDGRTLIQVIRLVFEKATDEATWSEMYARLCRKMMEQISANVQDDGIKNSEGKPIAGGQLFRKYLLNRCQEDFERGWVAKEATAAAAATKATQDQAAKAAAEESKDGESALYSEEYYAAQKAKRQGLGLIKFIGELFKLQMLTERIMHECVKKLLGNVENPEEEEIESLCKLLTTVGQILDTPKARAHMDVYFSRMKELCKSPNVNSRMQFMLQDIIELRERKWVPRNQVAAPTTIAAVHEAAAKEKAATEKDAYQRNLSMSRGGSRRGGERGEHGQTGPDGWATIGSSAPRPPPKAGDLSNFGKISKTASMTFGPSSIFAGKKETKRESRGSMNMFSMLSQNPELAVEPAALSKTSRPPSRKASIDLGQSGVPEAPAQRRKLNLLPRTVPKSDEAKADATPAASTVNSDDEESEAPTSSMTQAEAEAQVGEDCKEFFSVRDLNEAEVYFTKLPVDHRWRLVDKLVMSAIESKEADAQLVANLFERAASRDLCSPASFEQGFLQAAEILDDIAIDVPKAFNLMATMMKGARLDEERNSRLASKSMDCDKLLSLLSS